ncbi:MAG: hypothetical protein IKI35_00800, partial [Stomatobaculum sp.]|nr:hypothetical protein [Stomatobaculum sp.]
ASQRSKWAFLALFVCFVPLILKKQGYKIREFIEKRPIWKISREFRPEKQEKGVQKSGFL